MYPIIESSVETTGTYARKGRLGIHHPEDGLVSITVVNAGDFLSLGKTSFGLDELLRIRNTLDEAISALLGES